MGLAIPIAMGVAAAAKMSSSLVGGFGASAEHKLQAALAARDAEIAARNAGYARQSALRAAGMVREQGSRAIAKTVTSQAAGNVKLTSQTALAQVGGSAEMVELSARSVVNDGVRAALGYESQRDAFLVKSQAERRAARMAIVSGILGAAGVVAGGALSLLGGGTPGASPQMSGDINVMDPSQFTEGGTHRGWT